MYYGQRNGEDTQTHGHEHVNEHYGQHADDDTQAYGHEQVDDHYGLHACEDTQAHGHEHLDDEYDDKYHPTNNQHHLTFNNTKQRQHHPHPRVSLKE